MRYEIFGGNLPAVTVDLENGEAIYTQSGGMTWMSAGINMETNMKGGLMRGLGRMLSGDSLFMATYSATANGQSITFASTFPGNIVALDVSQGPYVCQKSAFLCAQPNVELKMAVTKGIKSGLFGGEGFLLQELSGSGMAFLEIDGSVKEVDLAPGEKLKVDTGNVAAFEQRVTYSVEMVKGFKNILFGGEGLFLTTVEGPGKVWLQTMTASGLASRLTPFMPFKKNDD
ncbi:MAG: TIGR00266 family protein [Oscillospiraceae bacterium]|nr:TIGR00266 family protein [Oscillospiraceae bacterium]